MNEASPAAKSKVDRIQKEFAKIMSQSKDGLDKEETKLLQQPIDNFHCVIKGVKRRLHGEGHKRGGARRQC